MYLYIKCVFIIHYASVLMYLHIIKYIRNTGIPFLIKMEQRTSANHTHMHKAPIEFACMEENHSCKVAKQQN